MVQEDADKMATLGRLWFLNKEIKSMSDPTNPVIVAVERTNKLKPL
jgi:hypothetical protein